MSVTIVVGGQYGSEAKGKCVVQLASRQPCALAIRTGGPNAGHTVYINNQKYVTRQLPSALAVPGVQLAIGAGGMVDVNLLINEIESLRVLGVNITDRLWIDPFAVIVDPTAGKMEEAVNLGNDIGSTQTGTGITQSRRIMRKARIARDEPALEPFIHDVAMEANFYSDYGRQVIIEGTQGFGLSMLHGGCYPFCTSRDTSASGFASEVGISPKIVGDIYMVVRTFPIRVGGNSGPIKYEKDWNFIREYSRYPVDITEMTSVTKKVRRVGLFDWDLMNRAVIINRPTHLVVAGLDYLNHEDFGVTNWDSLSGRSRSWINELETRFHVPVAMAFTGPNQDHLVDRTVFKPAFEGAKE